MQAYQLAMFGPRYVWVIIGDYVERWWEHAGDTVCTIQQLATAANGYFSIDSLNSNSEDDVVGVIINVFRSSVLIISSLP